MERQKLKLINDETGEKLELSLTPVERSLYRLRRACVAMARLELSDQDLEVYFLTTTLSDENAGLDSRALDNLLCWMRHRLGKFNYVWVASVQASRLGRTGIEALHWHFLILCKAGALPHCGYKDPVRHRGMYVIRDGDLIKNVDLVKYWGHGIVFCKRVVGGGNCVDLYLSKELRGNMEIEVQGRRRFGSSRFEVEDKLPNWAYDWVNKEKDRLPELEDLIVKRQPGRVSLGAVDGSKKFEHVIYKKSPWRKIGGWRG